jgi:hypothetical protein
MRIVKVTKNRENEVDSSRIKWIKWGISEGQKGWEGGWRR